MLISFKNTALLLVLAIVLHVPGVMAEDGWESAEKSRRAKAERAVLAEAARRRQAEEARWSQSTGTKQDVPAEAARRRQAEEARWSQSADTRRENAVRAKQNAELERMRAEISSARARAEAAEKARAETERTKALLESELKAAKSETASERLRAEAAEKAISNAEKSRAEAQSSLEAAEKARKEAERDKARAEAERDKAKAEAERDKSGAEARNVRARPREEVAEAKTAERDDSSGESVLATVGKKILWYIPNRLSDLMDIFTVELGAGELGVDLQLTRHLTFGAGVGKSYMLGWSIFNQHGIYSQLGWYADFLNLRASEIRREQVCGMYMPLYRYSRGSVDIGEMGKSKAEDPYAIGVRIGCYLNFKFQIHVTELADFVAGIFFIDFKDDDREKFNWVF